MGVTIYIHTKIQTDTGWYFSFHPEAKAENQMHVSNSSMDMLLALIEVDGYVGGTLIGTLTIYQLREMADKLDDHLLDLLTPTKVTQKPGRAKMIDIGYNADRLRGYAHRLRVLADEAEQLEVYEVSFA